MNFLNPSNIISSSCDDLATCFQAIYNLLFAILLALAFLYFLWGAFEYLLSGIRVASIESGKRKMINSIIAVIIALVIPVIINLINPEVFKAELSIPRVEAELPSLEEIVDLISQGVSFENLQKKYGEKVIAKVKGYYYEPQHQNRLSLSNIGGPPSNWKQEWNWRIIFPSGTLTNIKTANNDKGTEYINPKLHDAIKRLDSVLRRKGIRIMVTDGYSRGDHKSKQHTVYGTAFDVIVIDDRGKKISPSDHKWQQVIYALLEVGFCVLDERFYKGSEYSTGAHLHAQLCKI